MKLGRLAPHQTFSGIGTSILQALLATPAPPCIGTAQHALVHGLPHPGLWRHLELGLGQLLQFLDGHRSRYCFAASRPSPRETSTNAPPIALLDFPTPSGLSLSLSALSSSASASSYTLRSTGPLSGSIAYLYTSYPLTGTASSASLPLPALAPGYRPLRPLRRPDEAWWWETWHRGRRVDRRDVLLYGRMYLPTARLEALYLRRPSPATWLRVAAVSDAPRLGGNGSGGGGGGGSSGSDGSLLASLARDTGKYSTEALVSLDGVVLGARGLYNFGPDPRGAAHEYGGASSSANAAAGSTAGSGSGLRPHGRFSAGAELYYGLLNQSGGASTGLRFATLPAHRGTPYTMTLTLNPLMGNLSSTYAVRAGPALALGSRFDFNFYSYESGFTAGLELWRRAAETTGKEQKGMEQVSAGGSGQGEGEGLADFRTWRPEDTAGVLKARMNHDGEVGVLWEGRAKELLYSFGVKVDFKQREQIFRGVGLEIQYSS